LAAGRGEDRWRSCRIEARRERSRECRLPNDGGQVRAPRACLERTARSSFLCSRPGGLQLGSRTSTKGPSVEAAQPRPEGTAGSQAGDAIGGLADLSAGEVAELKRLGKLQSTFTSDPSSRRRNSRLLWTGIAVGLLGLVPGVVALATGDFARNG